MGTTTYSEQNHNPKEKGFKLKEYSRLKSHESFFEYDPKTGITFVLALRPIGAVAWESPFQLITTEPERVRRPEYSYYRLSPQVRTRRVTKKGQNMRPKPAVPEGTLSAACRRGYDRGSFRLPHQADPFHQRGNGCVRGACACLRARMRVYAGACPRAPAQASVDTARALVSVRGAVYR